MLNFDNWMEFKKINGRHVLHVIFITKHGLFLDFYLWEFSFRCNSLSHYCQHQQSAQTEHVGVSKKHWRLTHG